MSRLPRTFPGLLALCLLLVGASGRTLQQAKSGRGKADKAGKGFLSDALPLKITVTTPSNLADGKGRTLVLQKQQALTVVFSRSVTSLGEGFGTTLADDKIPFTLDPPLAGNGRWVTTYIYRFDPDGDWPPDSETELKWNAKLKSHDGIPLELPGSGKIVLTTESLTMDIVDVSSENLEEITGGAWDANVGMGSDILPEVPPDGKIELRFSFPVATETLAANLKVFNLFLAEESVEITAEPCEDFVEEKGTAPGESSCAMVGITSETGLEKGNRFVLTMEAGAEYSSKAGPLKNKAEASFGSIRAFRLPFQTGSVFVRSGNLDMWVPHGLPDDFAVTSLAGVMRINNALTGSQVPFELQQVDNTTLRIQANFEPSQTYRVNVIGTTLLKDALGLPLERSSMEFETEKIPAEFQTLQSGTFPSLAVFEEGEEWGQKIMALSKGRTVRTKAAAAGCKDVGSIVEIWNLDEEPSVISSFNIARSSNSRFSLETLLKKPDETLESGVGGVSADVIEVSVASLIGKSGALAHQYCSFERYSFHLTVETDLQVLFLRSGASGSAPATGTAWITSMSTGKPVEGATVKVYNRKKSNTGGLVAAKDYVLVSKGTSDELGRAALKLGKNLAQLDALVEYKKKFLVIPRIDIVEAAPNDVLDTLVLDRKLVKPEEELNVKGYVMQRDGTGLSPIKLKNARLVVTPTFNRTKEALASNGGFKVASARDTFPVTVNKNYGSFQASIAVPVDAPLTTYRISFEAVGAKGGPISGSSETFVVGDPRPPTVQLVVDAPKWAPPDSKVSIDVEAVSFIGAPVGGANMDVTWAVLDFTREEEDEALQGTTTIKTDSDGTGTAVIDLSVFEKPPSMGSTLEATIEWIGPTRELITEEVSIPLEVANIKFDFVRSSTTDLPKRSFSVRVNVTDLEDEALPKSAPVKIELKKLREPEDPDEEVLKSATGVEPIDGFSVEDCEVTPGAFEFDCRFSMPVVGEYAVEACVESGKATVCGREFMGLSVEQWKEDPLVDFPDVGLTELSKGPYKVGSVAKFALENPFVNAHAFIAWGSELGMKQKVTPLDDVSLNEVEIPVDDVCEANCAVYVAVAIPRQLAGAGVPQEITVHPLFDPALPHTETFTRSIEVVQDRSVDVTIDFPKLKGEPVVAPGESTPVEVQATGPAEITLIVVDKAILELVPLKLKDLAAEFVLNLAMRFSESSTSDFLVSPQAIEVLMGKFLQRNELNPWAATIAEMLPSFGNVELALSDEDYLDSIKQFITEVPVTELDILFRSGRARLLDSTPFAAPSVAKVGLSPDAESETEEEGGLVRIQKEFVSTPTFKTAVTKSGKATISFNAPDNLGTFVVRAYAVTDDGKFGSQEEELIVRRTVSLTPSAPRFARIGDVFEGGAVVTVTGIKKASVAVTVTANPNLDIVGPKSVKVKIGSDGQEEVRFKFKATKIGEADFTISADAGSGSKDSLKISFPVEGLQEQVTLGSSFSVPAKAEFVEVLDLPRALPGSGSVKINAGVGQLPAVLSMIQDIFEENLEKECPIDADFALAAIAIPVVAEAYNVLDFDDNLIGKETLAIVEQVVPAYVKGFLALGVGNMTDIKRGLQYSLPCPEDRNDEREKPLSLRQNAKGAWLFSELLVGFQKSELEAVANGTAGLDSLNALWLSSTAGALVQEATELRKKSKSKISPDSVAMARAALGASYAPPPGSSKDVVADLSMARLSKDLDEMSVEGQAYYILTRLRNDEGGHPDVQKAIDGWVSNTRVGGRTAYIARSEGSAAAASNVGNALALLAMVKAGVSNEFLPKLANYIARPPVSQFGFRAHTNFDKITAMLAIRAYDESTGSALPNIRLIVKSGKEELMNFVLNDANRPVSTASVPWEELANPPKPIEVSAEGVGAISMAISMTFVPTKLLTFPTFNGIFVERGIQIAGEETNEAGPSLAVVPVGSIVVVNVQITTPDELGSTSVRILMPAGLEPIDPNVEQEGNVCPLPFFEFFGPRFFFSCPVQETSPTVVTFTYDSLTAGAHEMTFRAIAASAGEFALPPVRAFVNEQPEIMGLSSAGSLEVCSGKGCKPVAEKPLSIPKTCPKDCNGLGACDVESGTCLCLDGFKGKDCGKIT